MTKYLCGSGYPFLSQYETKAKVLFPKLGSLWLLDKNSLKILSYYYLNKTAYAYKKRTNNRAIGIHNVQSNKRWVYLAFNRRKLFFASIVPLCHFLFSCRTGKGPSGKNKKKKIELEGLCLMKTYKSH